MPQPQVRVSLDLRFVMEVLQSTSATNQSQSGLKVCVGGIAKCLSHTARVTLFVSLLCEVLQIAGVTVRQSLCTSHSTPHFPTLENWPCQPLWLYQGEIFPTAIIQKCLKVGCKLMLGVCLHACEVLHTNSAAQPVSPCSGGLYVRRCNIQPVGHSHTDYWLGLYVTYHTCYTSLSCLNKLYFSFSSFLTV